MGPGADAADADATWTVAEATSHRNSSVNVQVVKKILFKIYFFFFRINCVKKIFVFKSCMLESIT